MPARGCNVAPLAQRRPRGAVFVDARPLCSGQQHQRKRRKISGLPDYREPPSQACCRHGVPVLNVPAHPVSCLPQCVDRLHQRPGLRRHRLAPPGVLRAHVRRGAPSGAGVDRLALRIRAHGGAGVSGAGGASWQRPVWRRRGWRALPTLPSASHGVSCAWWCPTRWRW